MGLIELNDKNFDTEVIKSELPVLVDYWASWCGPCRMVSPVVEELSREFNGKIKVAKVNVDDNSNLATRFRIMNIPTLVLFKGGKEVDRIVGVTPKTELVKRVNKILG